MGKKQNKKRLRDVLIPRSPLKSTLLRKCSKDRDNGLLDGFLVIFHTIRADIDCRNFSTES